MVLFLGLSSLSRSSATSTSRSSRRRSSSTASFPTATTTTPSRSASSTSGSASKSKSNPQPPSSPSASSSTLTEALRTNPFGLASFSSSKPPQQAPLSSSTTTATTSNEAEEQAGELRELNDAIAVLAQLFPDIKIEVFRELVVRFDGTSRLQLCVEQLLRYRSEWVRGRWKDPDTAGNLASVGETATSLCRGGGDDDDDDATIPFEELLRSEEYKAAAKATLSQEFRSLTGSTIAAVLAEVNYSYTRARPTLQELSRRTWRATLGTFLPFRRKRTGSNGHPLLMHQKTINGDDLPYMKETGCVELDTELHDAFLTPVLARIREEQESEDLKLAEELNEMEAQDAEALYECCCCLSDVTFEQIATCSESSHVVCFTCIQRTLHQAVFGQGWANSVEPEKSTLRCLAPLPKGTCPGSLDQSVVKRAALADRAGSEIYGKFEDRLFSDCLLKSQLTLIRCPFCSYAEIDPIYHPSGKGAAWRFRRTNLLPAIITVIGLLDLIPLLLIPILALLLIHPSAVTSVLSVSLRNLTLKSRNKRLTCMNPSCRRQSCITCHRPWRNPHVCHEPLLLSLRNTVEAARTAAIKRTCPRCGLSFVKDSGCNKLTCVCGYSMCYVCRKALGQRYDGGYRQRRHAGPARQGNALFPFGGNFDGAAAGPQGAYEDADLEPFDAPEGYQHFCEHFRFNPGSRCTKCSKCDLYQAEDEEAVAQRAGEKAEREWRARQGLLGRSVPAELGNISMYSRGSSVPKRRRRYQANFTPVTQWDWDGMLRFWTRDLWRDGRWKGEAQRLVDMLVESLVVVEH